MVCLWRWFLTLFAVEAIRDLKIMEQIRELVLNLTIFVLIHRSTEARFEEWSSDISALIFSPTIDFEMH